MNIADAAGQPQYGLLTECTANPGRNHIDSGPVFLALTKGMARKPGTWKGTVSHPGQFETLDKAVLD